MSQLTDVIKKIVTELGGIHVERWHVEYDRKGVERISVNFDLDDSIAAKAVVFEIGYKDETGVPHIAKVTTRFQKDGTDIVQIDGDFMENAYIDTDVMGGLGSIHFQLECRYNNPTERTTPLTDDENKKHIKLGNGNHELRIIAGVDLGIQGELNALGDAINNNN